jgi:hypothetical protein
MILGTRRPTDVGLRRMKAKLLVAIFVLLEVVATLGMMAISVHGPAGTIIAAFLYLPFAAVLTWWIGHRFANVGAVIGVGVPLLLAPIGIVASLGQLERIAYNRRVAGTRVENVRDEPIESASGKPIGVRVSYSVTVPATGYFAIFPSLASVDRRTDRLYLNSPRWTIDGDRKSKPFERGKTHAVVVELYPSLLQFPATGPCIATWLVPRMPDSGARAPLRVSISDTPYGDARQGQPERLTTEAYDLVELYRNVLSETPTTCAQ